MIDVSELRIRFGSVEVVKGVSFSVKKGESFGLVGESGSGKSTILRAISGLIKNWAGSIAVDGDSQGTLRQGAFFRRAQMVFQDPYASLHPRQTVDRALNEPLIVHRLNDRDQRVRRALDEVSLPASARFKYPHQLSGGQRQRVAIARALIIKPELLLLDEPTSALDVSVQAEVINLLSDLREHRNLTCLFVSHNLPVVAHFCSSLGVLRDGAMVEITSSDKLRNGLVEQNYTRELRALSLEHVAS
ncbi:ABC transporter ATP-binding protein [Mesorhizobium sp.]|uniref:ABC transporter ATP-binding protein n=1 Tax=Mesorhizobium sp. TaxID=1871066 RepID=UPI000FE5BDB9|nr:ABC transporter ATP-binding protein [Mesorhizobium sp.]RWI87944.1 MAG: ABC transporter ATP-binding protein [Mesorhizobium sp.]